MEIRHGYLAAISYLDAQVGRVLEELDGAWAARQHDRRLLVGPRLPSGRTHPVGEDLELRTRRPRAADHRHAGHASNRVRRPTPWPSCSTSIPRWPTLRPAGAGRHRRHESRALCSTIRAPA